MKRRKVEYEFSFPDEVWNLIKTYTLPVETWLNDGSLSYRRAWMGLQGRWFPKLISLSYDTDRKVEWLKAWANDHYKSLPVEGNVLIYRDEYAPQSIHNWYTHLARKDDCAFTLEVLEDVITSTREKANVWVNMAVKEGPFIDKYDFSQLVHTLKGWIDQSYRSWEIRIMARALHGDCPTKHHQVRSIFAGILMSYLSEGTGKVENVRCMLESRIFPQSVIRTFVRHIHLLDDPPFWQEEFALYIPGGNGWSGEMHESDEEDGT